MSDKLSFDLDSFKFALKTFKDARDEFIHVTNGYVKVINNLKGYNKWSTGAGVAFREIAENDWEKELKKHREYLKLLVKNLDYAYKKYSYLYDSVLQIKLEEKSYR